MADDVYKSLLNHVMDRFVNQFAFAFKDNIIHKDKLPFQWVSGFHLIFQSINNAFLEIGSHLDIPSPFIVFCVESHLKNLRESYENDESEALNRYFALILGKSIDFIIVASKSNEGRFSNLPPIFFETIKKDKQIFSEKKMSEFTVNGLGLKVEQKITRIPEEVYLNLGIAGEKKIETNLSISLFHQAFASFSVVISNYVNQNSGLSGSEMSTLNSQEQVDFSIDQSSPPPYAYNPLIGNVNVTVSRCAVLSLKNRRVKVLTQLFEIVCAWSILLCETAWNEVMEKVSNAKTMYKNETQKLRGKELKQFQSKMPQALLDIEFEAFKIIPLMSEVIKLLQLVWNTEISFLLEKNANLHRSFRKHLHELILSVEGNIRQQIHNVLMIILQMFKELIEQKQNKSEFVPKEKSDDSKSSFIATEACGVGIAFLRKQITRLKEFLNGDNRKMVLTELGIATRNVLYTHYKKYTYNMTGALRLQWDIAEYSNFFSSEVDNPDVGAAYSSFKNIANICVLKPHCLKEHIQMGDKSKCTIDHYLEYFKTRSDYKQIHNIIEEQLGRNEKS
jgi:hypothetical protein